MQKRKFSGAVLITGGAGFIGSHLAALLSERLPAVPLINLDTLTSAGSLSHLEELKARKNHRFVKGDVRDTGLLDRLFSQHGIEAVVHLAAETHVDDSIEDPLRFVRTNVEGTVRLLEAARNAWKHKRGSPIFYHISSDEVFGSSGQGQPFSEDSAYRPNNPYSASKASADHFVRSYARTYGLPVLISHGANTFGPRQHADKLIPKTIQGIVEEKPVPLYGSGKQLRSWIYVEDHAKAICKVLLHGRTGQSYNVAGTTERRNIELVNTICGKLDALLERPAGTSEKLVQHSQDRPGHDFRYAMNGEKLHGELGWRPKWSFDDALDKTIRWYLAAVLRR